MKRVTNHIGWTIAAAAVFLLAVTGYGISWAASPQDSPVRLVPENFTELAQQVRPGVVNIRTVRKVNDGGPVFRHFFGAPQRPDNPFREFFGPFSERGPMREHKKRSLGSGFIIDDEGYIVTNNHVIEKADEITVKLADGNEFEATVVGRDPNTDLALIKIEGAGKLTPLQLGDSDKTQIGGWVVAIGSPFGLEQTVTAGIVSAKGRVIGAGPYDDFIQTDASINPGNSGGPLLNMRGEVIGINTAIIASGQGIGFAIPVNLAKGIISQLKDEGHVTRGWLGVGIQDVTSELAEYYGLDQKEGALVTQVYEDHPADKGGIRSGDLIVAVDGKPITSSRDLSATIAGLPVGKKTSIELLRGKKHKTVTVELAQRNDEAPLSLSPAMESGEGLGIDVIEMTPEIAQRLGYDEDERGILVSAVREESKAEKAGLKSGDLIKEVNRKPTESIEAFRAQIEAVDEGEALHLLLRRPQGGFVVVKMTK